MRRSVLLDTAAIEDIRGIYESLRERFGKATADRSLSRLLGHLDSFEMFPERGQRVDGQRLDLRTVGYRRMVTIAFRVEPDRVTIVRVFAAGREVRLDD